MHGANGGSGRLSAPRRGRWSQAEQARLKELFGLRDDGSIARELNRPVASVRKMAEKLFPLGTLRGPWTASEVLRLKHYLGASSADVIARVLGREVGEVREQIIELGRITRDDSWSREDVAEFKRIYGRRTDEDLARIFGREVQDVREVALEHALAKDKAFLRKRNGEASTIMPRWTAEELEILKREYPTKTNLELAHGLKRSVKSVVSKAHNLGLKKSPGRLREMGRQNVSLRYVR